MSDRFYLQMRQATGWCPGLPESYKKRRKRMSTWTDETKQEAIDMYVSEEPTPENSMEIVKSIAEQLDQSPNGVRMILTKAGVYVKKNPAVNSSGGGTGGGRVSVAAAQEELTNAVKGVNFLLPLKIIEFLSSTLYNVLAFSIIFFSLRIKLMYISK